MNVSKIFDILLTVAVGPLLKDRTSHNPKGTPWTVPKAKTFSKARIYHNLNLLSANESLSLFDGVDTLLFLVWILDEFAKVPPRLDRFALKHWDVQAQNILVDSQHNLVGYQPISIRLIYRIALLTGTLHPRCLC
jgi:hypothetical protein